MNTLQKFSHETALIPVSLIPVPVSDSSRQNNRPIGNWRKLLKDLHTNEAGTVSLETVLLIGAIALPILIFFMRFGWPKIREFFQTGLNGVDNQSRQVVTGP